MEIPVINRIGNFESGITTLQNPSFLSQIISLSHIEKVSEAYSFWKWGALIIAVVASFGTIVSRIKILAIRLQHRYYTAVASEHSLLRNLVDDDEYSSESDYDAGDDDDAVSWSSASSISEFDDDEAASTSDVDSHWRTVEENFHVKGSGHYVDDHWQNRNLRLRRRRSFTENRFSWSDFASGKSVVKLWDSLGLGLDIDGTSGNVVSMYDMDKEQKIGTIFGGTPATATSSPASLLSAGTNSSGNVSFGLWDTRDGCRIPAIFAEWGPHLGKIVGIASDGAEKVYVSDDVTGGFTVGDLRNVSLPMKSLTASEVEKTWWDTDAVLVSNECFDDSATVTGRGSAVTRCCDAVRSYLL